MKKVKVEKIVKIEVKKDIKYFVSDPSGVDRVIDIEGIAPLVFRTGEAEKLEISAEVAKILKDKFSYLLVEEL